MRFTTKWARHEFRHVHLQAAAVQEHSLTQGHKVAVAAFLRPDTPVRMALQATLEDRIRRAFVVYSMLLTCFCHQLCHAFAMLL